MTIEEWKKFLSDFKPFVDDGCLMNLAGGETFIKESVLDLIHFATKLGYVTAAVTSAYLIDEELAKKIADTALAIIGLSLESLNEETHDFLRGVKGSYKRVMEAILYLKRFNANLSINIQTVILGKNLNDIIGLVEWAQANTAINNINFQAIVQPFDAPLDTMWYKKDNGILWPNDLNNVHRVLDHLIELKNKGYKIGNSVAQLRAFKAYFENPEVTVKKCNILGNSFEVDYCGNVKFCPREEMGNIKRQNISDIFCPEVIDLASKKIANCKRVCHFGINCFFESANIEGFQ